MMYGYTKESYQKLLSNLPRERLINEFKAVEYFLSCEDDCICDCSLDDLFLTMERLIYEEIAKRYLCSANILVFNPKGNEEQSTL